MADTTGNEQKRQHPPRVLVVGAGLSGCVAAWCVRRTLGSDAIIEVWDGARGCGGRLATQRVSIEEQTIRMNMGAPRLHFATGKKDGKSNTDGSFVAQQELIRSLETAGVVNVQYHDQNGKPIGTKKGKAAGGILRPRGASNEICRWMLTTSNVQTKFQSRLRSIDLQENGDGKRQQFRVSLFGNNKNNKGRGGKSRGGNDNKSKGGNSNESKEEKPTESELFDAVIFAGSPAEVRTTYGDMQGWTKPMWRQLQQKVQHTRTCCIGLVFRVGSDDNDDVATNAVPRKTIQACFPDGTMVLPANDKDEILEELVLQPSNMAHHITQPDTQQTSGPSISTQQNTVVIVAVSTEKFASQECHHLRATHRPSPKDTEDHEKIANRLIARVCHVLAARIAQASTATITTEHRQLSNAVMAHKMNYWKYAQVIQVPKQQHSNAPCFIAKNCGDAPFVVVGDYFPGSHHAQNVRDGNNKVCGLTAVVRSGQAAADEVARVLLD